MSSLPERPGIRRGRPSRDGLLPPGCGWSRGLDVSDADLLTRSLAHRSWCAENPGTGSNERLEFLGDAVLGLVVTDHLYRTYPDMPEGELAKVRASVVNSAALAELAAELDIGDALLLGKGEDQSGGREKPSILADAMEALIGAVYLDRGMVRRRSGWSCACWATGSSRPRPGPGGQDYKTRLQELCARCVRPASRLSRERRGSGSRQGVPRGGARPGPGRRETGRGRSKKQAEQAAARAAWEALIDERGERAPLAG